MANSLADFMSDPNLGGSTPGNSLIPMVRGNFGGSPDELEKIRQFAMSLPDPQQRNQLLAALQNNVNPMEQGPQMPPVPQPNQGELTRRQGGMFNYDANTGSFNPGGNVSRSDGQNYNLGPQQATPSDMAKAALMEKLRGTQNVPQEDFNSSALDALYDPATGTFRSGGAVRDNQTGKVTALGGGAPRQHGPVISYGVGNGGITQLKDSGGMPEADYSRVQVTIPGLGKGHYSTDGAYVVGEYDNGVRWKALLGYDHAATQANQAAAQANQSNLLKQELARADIDKTKTQTEKLRQEMNAPAGMPNAPAGYRWTQDGSRLEAIPGGPAGEGKPLTDAQSKALLFGNRMAAAEDIFGKLANEGVNTSIPGSRAPIVGGLINAFQPESRQQLDQAKRDFINATLRRESGAVISDSEFDNAEKQYFPQVGDGAKVIEQKKQNRQLARRSIDMEVPEASRGKGRTEQQAQAVNPGEAIFDAKKAIAAGKDRVWIVKKLESMGITNHGL